jgi:exopolysaccharide biosynthesis WecB/TagA/CpsF family protein
MFEYVKKRTITFSDVWETGQLDHSKVIYLNPSTYLYFRKNMQLLSNLDAVRFDGIFMSTVLKALGVNVKKRESFDMTSLAPIVFERCARLGLKIFVLGGAEGHAQKFMSIIREEYPKIDFVGYQNGYFSNKECVIEKINSSGADMVLVGLGGKRQEKFSNELAENFNGMVFTCGAFISQTTENKYYYPAFIDKFQLRWLYRFIKEKGIFTRVLKTYPKFLIIVIVDFLLFKKQKQ